MASGAKGTIGNPYSMSEYQDLLENNLWEGSWVEINGQNIYITKKEFRRNHEEVTVKLSGI